MLRRLQSIAFIGVALAATAGCSTTKAPSVTLINASLGDASDHAATVMLDLELNNPNDNPVELLEFTYKVFMDGKPVYEGVRSAQMTLARESTREAQVPAVFDFATVGWTLDQAPATASVHVKGQLRYLAPGALEQTLFDTGVKRPKASFSGTRTLDLHAVTPLARATR